MLRQANKPAEALATLEESLKADDQNVGTWVTLTEIHSATDGVEASPRSASDGPPPCLRITRRTTCSADSRKKGQTGRCAGGIQEIIGVGMEPTATIEAKTRIENLLNRR